MKQDKSTGLSELIGPSRATSNCKSCKGSLEAQ
jgi:hypothetical protein